MRTTFQASPSFSSAEITIRRGVYFATTQAVHRRAGEGMVVVVPRLTQGRERQPEHVGRPVVGVESAAAKEVAHRIHAPGDVVDEEDPYQPAPEEPGRRAGEGPADQIAGERGNRQAEQGQRHEMSC